MPKHRPPTATLQALEALGQLAVIAAQVEALTTDRRLLIIAAYQHGARLTDIATATGLSRSMVARMTGARR